jgi:hypothetical protein
MDIQPYAGTASRSTTRVDFLLFGFDLDSLMLDIQAQARVDTHVLVRNPDQGKPGNQISSPAIVKQLVVGDDQEQQGYIVAEAILARKNIEKFSAKQGARRLTLLFAVVPRLMKQFLMRYRPGNACHWNRK